MMPPVTRLMDLKGFAVIEFTVLNKIAFVIFVTC